MIRLFRQKDSATMSVRFAAPFRTLGPLRRVAALFLLSSIAVPALAEPACSVAIPVGAACEIGLDALHPTQSAIGVIEVEERAKRMAPGADFIALTRKRPIPVVQGPDGTFYLTDGHHFASMLLRVGAERVVARVIGRFASPSTFWTAMRTRHWVYLYDAKGRPISPSELPAHLRGMADDPYRSLASYAERAGYIKRTDAYFMEFEWARYFGARMGWRTIDALHLLPALEAAKKLACQPEASSLPGYAGPCNHAN
jgi:hypothetical protein